MSEPIFSWPMKTMKLIFGEQKMIQLQNAKFIYNYSNPTPEIQQAKQKMTEEFGWNIAIGFALAITTNLLTQKFITSARKLGVTSIVIDVGVFAFWGSLMGAYTLNELQPQFQPLRRKWIRQLHPQYLRVMRHLNKYYQIKLQDQISPYVSSSDQLPWKLKFDTII